jgi:eukaryotic-like serine/threonine-protein kinase
MADRSGQQLGRYRLTRLLGQGSFAEVYLGEHVYLKAEAAVKVLGTHLAGDDVEDFLNEAQTIARLVHPNIVRIFDFDVQESIPFLVMDYAPNGTLRKRHPKGKPVPLHTVLQYIRQVADALQFAHERKLIHRDVKPENMLLGRHNEVLLSDFGIVQIAQPTGLETTQEFAGTLAYMAPEQLQGKARVASDQYALGIVVYEWLAGERPFQGTFSELASQHLFMLPTPLHEKVPTIPPDVEEVVMTALAKDPKQRFASEIAFARAFEQACNLTSSFPSIHPAPASIGQPAQVQEQAPIASIPPVASNAPVHTDKPSHFQQPLTPPPLPGAAGVLNQSQQPSLPSAQPAQPPYPPTDTDPGRLQRHKNNAGRSLLLITLAILVVAGSLTAYFVLFKKPSPGPKPPFCNGLAVCRAPDGEYIGISDGTFAFDTNRPDGALKLQAANKLKSHNIEGAETLWLSALQKETNDAEASIYLEDQRVIASGHPYITFAVGTVLSGAAIGAGRGDLQGAYVAQKEFNDGLKLPGGREVRLLIANSGSQSVYASTVAQQIVQVAQADKTIVGVMGWPFGVSTKDAISVLGAAHIPTVSPTAFDDFLTGISPYFFRVIPPVYRQASVAAQYAEHKFHAKKVAIFVDPNDAYSKNLAADFGQRFTADGNTIVATETYTVGQPETLPAFLQGALSTNPDLVFFAGYAEDVTTLLAHLPTSGRFAGIQVLGGEALYEDYHSGTHAGLNRLHFTASAYAAEWDVLKLSAKKPAFFTDFEQDFYAGGKQTGGTYIYASIATLLSYDATLALLTGSSNAFASGKKNISPDDLRLGLAQITGPNTMQGVSGQISFGPDGDPVNKVVLILDIDSSSDVEIESLQGSLLVGS